MKGITCCGDCNYYNWNRHKCSRGCKDEGAATDHFYKDCPLPDVQPIKKRYGAWIEEDDYILCSDCNTYWNKYDNCTETFKCCPNCGAKMELKELEE